MRPDRLYRCGLFRLRYVFLTAVIIAIFLSVLPGVSRSEKKALKGSPEASRAMYQETQITYRNTVTPRSFNKSADLTYNPYYAMQLDFALAFTAKEKVTFILDTALSREFTNSDTTTRRGETELADIFLETALLRLKPIPVLGLDVVPSFRLFVPSSKASQARTMILGIRPSIVLSKTLKVLSGLSFSYGFWIRKDFHEFTTASSEYPIILDAMGSTRSADSFSNLGKRNISFAISNSLGLVLYLTDRVGARVSAAVRHGFLYDLEHEDPRTSYTPQTKSDVMYEMMYQGEAFVEIGKAWVVALGFLTENNQLALNATYEAPFVNRYTALYLDIRLDAAGLVSQLSSKRGKK